MPGTGTHILELRACTGVPTPRETSDDPVARLAAGEYGVQVVQRPEPLASLVSAAPHASRRGDRSQ